MENERIKFINDELVNLLDISIPPKFLQKLLFFKNERLYIQDIPNNIINDIVNFTSAFPKRNAKVSVLTSKNSIIYLLGVNKCNEACQADIAEFIKYIQPDVILIELCANRACGCEQHVDNVFQKSQKLTYHHLQNMISEIGFLPAFLYYANLYREKYAEENLWLECKEELIKTLIDMKENTKCEIILGDRPIDETIKRELKLLKYWDKARLVSQVTLGLLLKPFRKQLILNATKSIRKSGKNKNILVLERDIYLTYCLQTVARKSSKKNKVIAIISEGHMKGVQTFWGKVTPDAMNDMLHSDP